MSVNRELNLLKQPSNNRMTCVKEDLVMYFRNNALIAFNPITGTIHFDSDAVMENYYKERTIHFSREFSSIKCIKAIACHPDFGLNEGDNQLVAIAYDTGTISLYDHAKAVLTKVHNEHRLKGQGGWIGLHMTEEGTIISVSDHIVVKYCSVSKKAKVFNDLLPKKFIATEMSSFRPNLLAIGSYCGLVVVVSLTDMTLKYSFRGHNYQIQSIVWMRNISELKEPKREDSSYSPKDDDDCFDIYDDSNFRGDFGSVQSKPNAREGEGMIKDVEPVADAATTNRNFDFVEACQTLKEEMLKRKTEGTALRPSQPNREECKQFELDNSDGSLASGFSNESQASSTIEALFEKIDINEDEDLTLVTLDQHMNVWVWDVKLNCAKGNFKITTKTAKQQFKKPVYQTAQFLLLDDNRTIVGNTCTANFFSLELSFDTPTNKLRHSYQVTEINSIVFCATTNRRFLAFYPNIRLKLMEFVSPKQLNMVSEYSVYNSVGKTIAVSEVNPTRIAIGSRDICFFDLTTLSDSNCSLTTYNKNLKSAVVCLAWHPENEILAFGTMEGRIGLYNSVNQSVQLLKPFTGVEMYHLAFAKIEEEIQLIASCSSGLCVSYFNDYSEFKTILPCIPEISAIFVDNHLKKLFVGTKTGSVHHLDLINGKSLHPAESHPIKVSRNYIRMFRVNSDHSKVVVAPKNNEITVIPIEELISASPRLIKLKGHSKPVNWVDFSSKNPNLLLSTSYDATIRLWDLSQTTTEDDAATIVSVVPINCFEFDVNLLFAIFSPLDENCIIVSNFASSFYVFNTTAKTNDFPPKIIGQTVQPKSNMDQKEPTSTTPPTSVEIKTGANSSSNTESESKVVEVAKKNESTIFYLAKRESNNHVTLMQCLQSIIGSGDEAAEEQKEKRPSETDNHSFRNKKIFSNDLDQIKDFLLTEVKNYKASNMRSLGTEFIPLVTGNVKETLVQHMKEKSLTDEMVAISPMVSHNFWKLCLEAYALQLIDMGQALKAVLYLLSIHKVDDSLKLLTERHFFREAWILAKLRKPQGDAIFGAISSEWIKYLDLNGEYEFAAVVAAAIGNYKSALELLMKRREEHLTDVHRAVIKSLKAKEELGK